MKRFLLCTLFSAAVYAQTPPGSFTPDTVVAKIDGKDVTAGEIQKILDTSSPAFLQAFRANPAAALSAMFVRRHLAEEADKLKLADQSPWKEQIEAERTLILANAMVSHESNTFNFSPADVEAAYEKNKSRFEQVRIKVIK